eukprot:349837_1
MISSLSSFTVPVMTKFVSKCRQVIHFSMKGITDPLLTVVAQSCPHLRTLIIPENNSVGPKSILSVVEHCADSLETLSLECVKIGDVFVNDIVENCKRIRTLALHRLNITSSAVFAVMVKSVLLEHLSLRGEKLDDSMIQAIVDTNTFPPRLCVMDVRGTAVTAPVIVKLKSKMPVCVVLSDD